MKYIAAMLILLSISIAEIARAQIKSQGFPEGKTEVYFFFRIASRSEVNEITRQISIDNVRNDTVWAYANIEEFLRFSKNGYDITLLPSPGDAPGVMMRDNIQLSTLTTWNFYPTYPAYESLMADFQTNYPEICQVTTIATLPSGRKLLVAKISDNVSSDEDEPEFLYTSSIHGDETTGYVLMLHLMDYLLSNYGTNPEATELINNLEIFINPLANPDGTYKGGNNTVNGATRSNANNVDLNRNYPDPVMGQHPDGKAWQPETVAFMDFAAQHHFVAAANFHGGIEVVNYPWDCKYVLTADDSWWQYVSREYVDTVHLHSPITYMDDLTNGITNGAVWYIVYGGRQDYMNYWHHCREVTIEISNTKLLPASQLVAHWDYNWRSLILFMKQARYGIHGIITNQVTGNPIAAKVFINGHDIDNSECYSSSNNGDYHRLLKTGAYTLEISAPCYQTQTIANVMVTDKNTISLDIQLLPSASASVTTTSASGITVNTALSGGNILCEGTGPITARGVCWSTSASPTISDNHTADGSGPGSFTSVISGLSATTVYHVRAYATNANGTVYGEDLTFTTSCGAISAFPWNEGFENGGSIPACWSQEYVTTPGLDWTFISGSGNSHPAAAHGGTMNACLKDATASDNKTRLITPPLNLTALGSPVLKFWHTQALWSPDQDQLIVYYRTSATGTWTTLATYTSSITAWTEETISLPNPGSEYYIAFEGNAKYGYGVCIDDVSVTGTLAKNLNISVLFEGLFNGEGMNNAQGLSGNQFAGTIADQFTVELHNSNSPFTVAAGPYTIDVNTNGTATIQVSGSLTGSYYIAIKHRNSIETWSGVPVSLSGTSASYDFTTAAGQAFGNNLKFVSGKYVVYSGDVNQDGAVNESDALLVGNSAAAFSSGYISSDINGDGLVDAQDLVVIDNNAAGFVGKITP
jgi:hypothetical protein